MTVQAQYKQENMPDEQRSFERMMWVMIASRYFIVFTGAAFLAWKLIEVVGKGGDLTSQAMLELYLISLVYPSVVWWGSRFAESLARNASQSYGDIVSSNLRAQSEIAERTRAETDLVESEAMWRALFNCANDAVYLYEVLGQGEVGKLIEVNGVACERLGYTREELLTMTPRDFTFAEASSITAERMRSRMAGLPVTFDRVQRSKDGREIPVEISSQTVTLNGRRVALSIARDITKRKEAIQALRVSEERFRKIFEHSNDAIFVVDPTQENIIDVNPRACAMLGYSREELLSLSISAVHPQDPAQLRSFIQTVSEQGVGWTNQITCKTSAGTSLATEISSSMIDVAGTPTMLFAVRDVTHRLHLEVELRKVSQAVDQSPSAVIITDTEANIQFVNPKFTEITGYTREDVIGRNMSILKSGETPADKYIDLWETIISGKVWRGQLQNMKKNGELYWSSHSIAPIHDPDGTITHYLAIEEDVTERKYLEEQLVQAQKMESVGRLAGGIAHDFNNLLTAIVGYTQLGSMSLDTSDPVSGHLIEVRKAAARATELTRQLLAFSHHKAPENEKSDLNSLILNLDRMLRRLIGTDIELVTLLASNQSWVNVDVAQMEQVVINLAINARDAMPDGGKLIIETSSVLLDAEYARRHSDIAPGRYVMLRVSDTGTGMPEEVKSHIFEPFFTTKETGSGTGLGLATCYGVVNRNGGQIEVDTELGKGTTFKVYLPEAEPGADRDEHIVQADQLPQGSETVLLTEDEPQILAMVGKMLTSQGYNVIEATNGDEALRLAGKPDDRVIDLLLTDMVMPQMGGKELATELRAGRPDVKVMFTSGYTEEAVFEHGLSDGGVAFLQKPFMLDDLARKVRELLDS
jgi:PAS domain S-box-containing protein